jgi:hypothetical protein
MAEPEKCALCGAASADLIAGAGGRWLCPACFAALASPPAATARPIRGAGGRIEDVAVGCLDGIISAVPGVLGFLLLAGGLLVAAFDGSDIGRIEGFLAASVGATLCGVAVLMAIGRQLRRR